MRLETLVLELMADTSALNRDIDKAINKATQQVKGLENKSVTVKAPLQHLVALNKELDLKQKHILETARLASNNPIVAKADVKELKNLQAELNKTKANVKQTKATAKSETVKPSVNDEPLKDLRSQYKKTTSSHVKTRVDLMNQTITTSVNPTQLIGLQNEYGKVIDKHFKVRGKLSSDGLKVKADISDVEKLIQELGNVASKELTTKIKFNVDSETSGSKKNGGDSNVKTAIMVELLSQILTYTRETAQNGKGGIVDKLTYIPRTLGKSSLEGIGYAYGGKSFENMLREFEKESGLKIGDKLGAFPGTLVGKGAKKGIETYNTYTGTEAAYQGVSDVRENAKKASQDVKDLQVALSQMFSQPDNNNAQKAAEQLLKTMESIANLPTTPIDAFVKAQKELNVNANLDDAIQESEKYKEDFQKRPDISSAKRVFIVSGGFSGTDGKSSLDVASKLGVHLQDGDVVVPVENYHNDVTRPIMENPAQWVGDAAVITSRLGLTGVNKDASKMTGAAIAVQELNPQAKIKFVGYSGGGFNAEDAVRQSNLIGLQNVSGVALATPGLMGKSDLPNFQGYMGEHDPIRYGEQAFRGIGIARPNAPIKGVKSHDWDEYLKSVNVISIILDELISQQENIQSTSETINAPFSVDDLKERVILLNKLDESLRTIVAKSIEVSDISESVQPLALPYSIKEKQEELVAVPLPDPVVAKKVMDTPLPKTSLVNNQNIINEKVPANIDRSFNQSVMADLLAVRRNINDDITPEVAQERLKQIKKGFAKSNATVARMIKEGNSQAAENHARTIVNVSGRATKEINDILLSLKDQGIDVSVTSQGVGGDLQRLKGSLSKAKNNANRQIKKILKEQSKFIADSVKVSNEIPPVEVPVAIQPELYIDQKAVRDSLRKNKADLISQRMNAREVGSAFGKVIYRVKKLEGVDLNSLGEDTIEGLRKGLLNKEGQLDSTVKLIAEGLPLEVQKALGIASPSKVMFGLGVWAVKGLAEGFKDPSAEKSVKELAFGLEELVAHAFPIIGTSISAGIAKGIANSSKSFTSKVGKELLNGLTVAADNITGQVNKIGKRIGESLGSGIESPLEIKSPSERAKRIMKNVGLGLLGGVGYVYDAMKVVSSKVLQFANEMESKGAAVTHQAIANKVVGFAESRVDDAIDIVKKAKSGVKNLRENPATVNPDVADVITRVKNSSTPAKLAVDDFKKSLSGLKDELDDLFETNPSLKFFADLLGQVKEGVIGFVGLSVLGSIFASFAKDSFQSALAMERFKTGLSFANVQDPTKKLKEIYDFSQKIGSSFKIAEDSYRKLITASYLNPIQSQITPIFQGTQSLLASVAATPEQQQNVYLAMAQIMGKNRLQAEELQGQIAEALPQAPGIIARSLGKTEQELRKMMQSGSLSAMDVLPKFGMQAEIESQIPLLKSSQGINAEITRLNNNMERLRQTAGETLVGASLNPLKMLNALLTTINEKGKALIYTVGLLSIILGVKLVGAIIAVANSTRIGALVVTGFGNALRATASQIAPVLMITMAIEGLFKVITAGNKDLKLMVEQTKDAVNQVKALGYEANKPKGFNWGNFGKEVLKDMNPMNMFALNQRIITKGVNGERIAHKMSLAEDIGRRKDIGNVDSLIERTKELNSNKPSVYGSPEKMNVIAESIKKIDYAILAKQTELSNVSQLGDVNKLAQLNKELAALSANRADYVKENLGSSGIYQNQLQRLDAAKEITQTLVMDESDRKRRLSEINSLIAETTSLLKISQEAVNTLDRQYISIQNTLLKINLLLNDVNYKSEVNAQRLQGVNKQSKVDRKIDDVEFQRQTLKTQVDVTVEALINKKGVQSQLNNLVANFDKAIQDSILTLPELQKTGKKYTSAYQALLDSSPESIDAILQNRDDLQSSQVQFLTLAKTLLQVNKDIVGVESQIIDTKNQQKEFEDQRLQAEMAFFRTSKSNNQKVSSLNKVAKQIQSQALNQIEQTKIEIADIQAQIKDNNTLLAKKIGDPTAIKQSISDLQVQLANQRIALLQNYWALEDYNTNLARSIFDFNQSVRDQQIQITDSYRGYARQLEDAQINSKLKARSMVEGYQDLLFTLNSNLDTAKNGLLTTQEQIQSEKLKQQNLSISPGVDSIAKQVNSIFNQLFDSLTNGEQEKRQANLDAAQIQRQYVDTLRQIRGLEEEKITAQREQVRSIFDLKDAFVKLIESTKKLVIEQDRKRPDLIRDTKRQTGVDISNQLLPNPNYNYTKQTGNDATNYSPQSAIYNNQPVNNRVPFSVPIGQPLQSPVVPQKPVIPSFDNGSSKGIDYLNNRYGTNKPKVTQQVKIELPKTPINVTAKVVNTPPVNVKITPTNTRQVQEQLQATKIYQTPANIPNPVYVRQPVPTKPIVKPRYVPPTDDKRTSPTMDEINRQQQPPVKLAPVGKEFVFKAPVQPQQPNILQQGINAIGNGLNAVSNFISPPAQAAPISTKSVTMPTQSWEKNLAGLLNRYGSQMTVEDFKRASAKSGINIDALVTQAFIESHFGTKGRGRFTKNPLNYGNDDAGNNKYFKTYGEGLEYAAIKLKKDFFFTSPEDFMARNFKGRYGRYATDPLYKPKYNSALTKMRNILYGNLRSDIPKEFKIAGGISDMGMGLFADSRIDQINKEKAKRLKNDPLQGKSLVTNWDSIMNYWKQQYPESYSPDIMSKFKDKFIDTQSQKAKNQRANQVKQWMANPKPLEIKSSPVMLKKSGITKQIKENAKQATVEGITEAVNTPIKAPVMPQVNQATVAPVQGFGIQQVNGITPVPNNLDYNTLNKLNDAQKAVNVSANEFKQILIATKQETAYLEAIDNLERLKNTLEDANIAKTRAVFDSKIELANMAQSAKGYLTAYEQNQKVGYDIWKSYEDKRRAIADANREEERKFRDWEIQRIQLATQLNDNPNLLPKQKEILIAQIHGLDVQMEQSKTLQEQYATQANILNSLNDQAIIVARIRDDEDRRFAAMKEFGDLQANLASARYNYGGQLVNEGAVISAKLNAKMSEQELKRKLETLQVTGKQRAEMLAMNKELNETNIAQSYVDAIPFLKEFSSNLKDVVLQTTNWRDALKKLLDLAASTILDQLVIKPMQNGIANILNDWGMFSGTEPIQAPSNNPTSGLTPLPVDKIKGVDLTSVLSLNGVTGDATPNMNYDTNSIGLEVSKSLESISKAAPNVAYSFAEAAVNTAQNTITEQTALLAFTTALTTATNAVMMFAVSMGANPSSAFGSISSLGLSGLSGLFSNSFNSSNAAAGMASSNLSGSFGDFVQLPFFADGYNPIDTAMKKERAASGKNPMLAVINKDEVVLSANNNDAQLWQLLKANGEWDNLKATVPNYANGNTNITPVRSQSSGGVTVIQNWNVTTKDADSFRKSQTRLDNESAARLRRTTGNR